MRPKGWENPYFRIEGEQVLQWDAYEAGADAYEAGLKKDGQYVSNDDVALTSPYGLVLARTIKKGEKGYLVFIAEDE